MSEKLTTRNASGGTTSHFNEIVHMRNVARLLMDRNPIPSTTSKEDFYKVTILMASAALLEVHDASGISLDDWLGPRQLVETGLEIAGYDSDATLLDNGV